MISRKELVKKAKNNLKRHYWIFVAICLVAAFIGTEYKETLETFALRSNEDYSDDEESSSSVAIVNSNIDEISNNAVFEAIGSVITGDEDFGKLQADEKVSEAKKNATDVLGRNRGVLAAVINNITSGGIVFTFVDTIIALIGSKKIAVMSLIIIALLIYVFLTFFIKKAYLVISRRIILEGRIYDKVEPGKFMFLIRVKRWCKTAWVLFVTTVYTWAWSLTIVGLFIKPFSYLLVPYILAENPDLKANEAITLSRRMMKGYKFKAFLYGLSFLGWECLSYLTIGIVGILFVNPFMATFYAEFYVAVRNRAKAAGIEGMELLNDRFLYEKASEDELKREYAFVYEHMHEEEPVLDIEDYNFAGIRRLRKLRIFLANTFGIIIFNSRNELEFEEKKKDILKMRKLKDEATGVVYPSRLFTLKEKRIELENTVYMRNYSILSIIMIFFVLSIAGWMWEVLFHLITKHTLVNRGVLHGPWLPIYGSGAVLILMLLKKLRNRPLMQFIASMVLCGVIEYATSVILELLCNRRWWSYKGYFLNINGRVCAEGLLVFGIGGMMIVYFIAPLLDNYFRKIDWKVLGTVCVSVLAVFVIDVIYSFRYPNTGKGISSYNDKCVTMYCREVEPVYENHKGFYQEF